MKQLIFFLEKLNQAGFVPTCNWQLERAIHNGKMCVDHYTIKKDGSFVQVIFVTYGDNKGFGHYIESHSHTYDKAEAELNQILIQ